MPELLDAEAAMSNAFAGQTLYAGQRVEQMLHAESLFGALARVICAAAGQPGMPTVPSPDIPNEQAALKMVSYRPAA